MPGIVVGISASVAGAAALDWAMAQAVLRGVPLTAVRAWDLPSYGPYYSVGAALRSVSPDFQLIELQVAEEALRQSVARVPGAGSVQARAVAKQGRPPQVLVEAARQADLLVVGTHGLGALSRVVHLGSVTSSVLHHAGGPVAVVPEQREERRTAPPRVVVGVDGSEPSRRALRWAVEQCRLLGGELVPVAVQSRDRRPDGAAAADHASLLAAAERAGAGHDGGLVVTPELRVGQASSELLVAAEGASLLVVGSRGRGGFAALLLGSTSSQVAGHSGCPVVVVRPD